MLTFLDRKYTSIQGQGAFSRMRRFLFRLIANVLIPIYFNFFRPTRKRQLLKKTNKKIIVSLTSFPTRISKLWLVIECLIRQTTPPDMIVLYLSKEQFPNLENGLPKKLLKYKRGGYLEIVFVDGDLRSHKKYYYSFNDFPNEIIVVVDDDIFYVETMIEDLVNLHLKYPNAVCCHRAYEVRKKRDHTIDKYNKWQLVRSFSGPALNLFHTSGGGTLYIPSLISKEVLNKKVFKRLCFYADDIWLNFQIQKSNVFTVKSNYYSDLLPILRFKDMSLKTYNVQQNGNDQQLEQLMKYYNIESSKIF